MWCLEAMSSFSELELWGGHECTLNRIGEVYRDQSILTGHERREDDLERFAELGFRALRYPILWERVAPEHPDECDWTLPDRRLQRMKTLGMRVIAGLIHHGSGPRYAGIMSKEFAAGLAMHARHVAERYPCIQDWTPVNEPVTTARFVGLYGHWHPHRRDERAFWLALLNQVDATRFAMREIRAVNATARLVQTDDLGRTYATAALQAQAAHDNARRWMAWDLLFGRVTRDHMFWERLDRLGYGDRLRAIADDPCPPDIIGVNHYLTSDRFLDDRIEIYPTEACGGNGVVAFADVEAVRALPDPGPQGVAGALREAWARYGCPIALTEVHNASTRDEQARWFAEAWRTAEHCRAQGTDVRAVTAWSLLGAYDWNSLLTRPAMHYECGVFDVSSGTPRPTTLAHQLKHDRRADRSVPDVHGRGWWRRAVRFEGAPILRAQNTPAATVAPGAILITGAAGTLGRALSAACYLRDLRYVGATRAQLSICDPDAISRALDLWRPSVVINAAGFVDIDKAETERALCGHANVDGPAYLARACKDRGVPFVTFSSDLVFDGNTDIPYVESCRSRPLNAYGLSKAAAEAKVLDLDPGALLIRTAAFFSEHDPHNFAAWVVRELTANRRIVCAADVVISPTYVPSLAHAVLNLVQDRCSGIWHLTNGGAVTWYAFAQQVAKVSGLKSSLLGGAPAAELGWRAPRPRYSALGSERGELLRPLEHDVRLFCAGIGAAARRYAA